MNVICLIGMSRCGKTETGKALAEILAVPFFDTDAELEKKHGCKISALYAALGEKAFRTEEFAVFKEVFFGGKQAVISTGGGFADNGEAVSVLDGSTNTVLVDTEPAVIFERIKRQAAWAGAYPAFLGQDLKSGGKNDRAAEKRFYGVYTRRIAVYRRIAALTVEPDALSAEKTAWQIAKQLKRAL